MKKRTKVIIVVISLLLLASLVGWGLTTSSTAREQYQVL
jgi:hypothetical protein